MRKGMTIIGRGRFLTTEKGQWMMKQIELQL